MNILCLISEECSAKGGSNSGSCAGGFGVCCTSKIQSNTSEYIFLTKNPLFLVSLSCGGTSNDNTTYLVQGGTTSSPASPSCTYKICPCSNDICRIKYDFTTNVLASQVIVTGTAPATTAQSTKSKKILQYRTLRFL